MNGGAHDRTCVALQKTGGAQVRNGGALDRTGVALQRTGGALDMACPPILFISRACQRL